MLSVNVTGDFKRLEASLKKMESMNFNPMLEDAGQAGVRLLSEATPVDTNLAATSWTYKVFQNGSGFGISWHNVDIETGFPVALMLQYGYGTGTGGYVQGRDYINPPILVIFDKLINDVWKAVVSA